MNILNVNILPPVGQEHWTHYRYAMSDSPPPSPALISSIRTRCMEKKQKIDKNHLFIRHSI